MKQTKILAAAIAATFLCACSSHDGGTHDHNGEDAHATTTEHGHEEDQHQGLIVFDPHRAAGCGVTVDTVRKKPFARVTKVTGRIAATNKGEASVVAPASGIVQFAGTLVEGMGVGSGKVLLTINSSQVAGGDMAEMARTAYEIAKDEYERIKRLHADKIVTDGDYNAAKKAYEEASIAYRPYQTSNDGGNLAVSAPIQGFVKQCLVKEGDYVETGQQLLTIAKSDRLHLIAEVPERHAAALDDVRSANFRTAYCDETFSTDELDGRLVSVGRTMGDGTFYIPVVFSIRNAGQLIEGSYAEVFLQSEETDDAVVLPVAALVEEEGTYSVYKQLDEMHYKKQEVRLGGNDGMNVEIVAGVEEGERVVTHGAYQLKLAASSSVIPPHTHDH